MTDRELVSVFWATCAAIVLIWGIAGLVRLGVDRQERRELLNEITRLGQEIEADSPSPAAPTDSGFATRATDSTRPPAGETF